MNTKPSITILYIFLCALLLVGCQTSGQAAQARLSPLETVDAFYTWYVGYIQPGSEQMRNPLADRAYRESPYLSESMIKRVDALLESLKKEMGGGFDPFLLAQDIPQEIEVQPGAQADTVIARMCFGESWNELKVSLVEQGGRWLIEDVSRNE